MSNAAPETPAAPERSRWRHPALIAVLAVAAFAASARGGFVWDDLAFWPLSPRLAELTNPLPIFRHGVWWFSVIGEEGALYRPLPVFLAWAFQGVLGDDPTRWHLLDVLLHAAASVLVYRLARRAPFSAPPFAALCGAALFAVHPVHVEAVAYVGGYVHPLLTCFALVAAHAQLSWVGSGRVRWLALAVTSTLAALLTSEGGVVVSALALLLELAARRRAPSLESVVAHAGAVAVTFALRAAAVGGSLPLAFERGGFGRALSFAAAYLRNLLVPWPQRILADLPPGGVAGPADWLVAAVALALGAIVLVRMRAGERAAPLLGLAWIALPLAPIVAAALNANPFFAPRALYLPSVGLALLVAWAMRAVEPGTAARPALAGCAGVCLLACNVASGPWSDNLRLHLRMLEDTPRSARVHAQLAKLYAQRGDAARAELHGTEAVRCAPTAEVRRDALERLAIQYGTTSRLDDAERLLRALVAEDPSRASAWVNLGNVALVRGDREGAAASYHRALRLDPSNREAAFNVRLVQRAAQ